MKFSVCVKFKIKPTAWESFLPLMKENAKASLRYEEGCLQFDVCSDGDSPFEVFLYEIYTSEEAFADHLKTTHFLDFDSDTRDMVEEKLVNTYRTVD